MKHKKPVIAHFTNQIWTGGIEQVMYNTQKYIKDDFDSYYFTISEDIMGDEIRKVGGKVLTSNLGANIQFCKELKPDIILFHTAGYIPVEADALKELDSKKCIVVHSPAPLVNKPDYIDYVICVSKTVYNMQRYENKILIENGVDTENIKYEKQDRSEYGIKEDELVVGRLSRIAPDKLMTDFILMAQRILNKTNKVKFMVIGESKENLHPGYLDKIKKLIADLGISDYFIFTGVQKDLTKYLSMIDVFGNATSNEGFGMVYAEAMSAELPIVTYDNFANSELVVDNYNGLLAENRNVTDFADKILELMTDKEKRITFGKNGKTLVEEKYSARYMADKYKKLYNILIKE